MKKLLFISGLFVSLINAGNVFGQTTPNIGQVLGSGNNAGGRSIKGVALIELRGSSSGTVSVNAPAVVTTYTFTLPANDGTPGQYLQTDGNGVSSWQTVATGLTVGTTSIASGTNGYALYNNAGTLGNKLVWDGLGNAGTTAGTNFLGTTDDVDVIFKRNSVQFARVGINSNIFWGQLSAVNFTVNALSNTGGGANALRLLTDGDNNAAFGQSAGGGVTIANQGSFFGSQCFEANDANDNAGLGFNVFRASVTPIALTGIGSQVAPSHTSGDYVLAGGFKAMFSHQSGGSMTALGPFSFWTGTTNSGCVGLGYGAGYFETGNNKLFIHNSEGGSTEAESRTRSLIYGIFSTTAAAQTLTANAMFSVNTSPLSSSLISGKSFGATNATYAMQIQNSSSTNVFAIRDDARIGIRTISPGSSLQINDDGSNYSLFSLFNETWNGQYRMYYEDNAGAMTLEAGGNALIKMTPNRVLINGGNTGFALSAHGFDELNTSYSVKFGGSGLTKMQLSNLGKLTLGNCGADPSATFDLVQDPETGTTPTILKITGASHSNCVASTEVKDIYFPLTHTVGFATGALTTQRAIVVDAPTYTFTGASTITNAATLAIVKAPVAGTNATITNNYALWVQAGLSSFDGGANVSSFLKLVPGSAPGSPLEGMIYANSVDHHLYFYDGTTWKQLD